MGFVRRFLASEPGRCPKTTMFLARSETIGDRVEVRVRRVVERGYLILVCLQNRLGSLCRRLVFYRWHEPFPTDRKSAAGLSPVKEFKNEFAGDIERNWQGNH